MVTAVCNIFINSDSKFELFKQTFPRVYGVSDNWLINIRGKYREDVTRYIQETFKDVEKNCIFFSGLDDRDWAKSTRKMLESSKYDYVYVFLEDHFLLKPLDHFKDVIRDMIDSKIEYFGYSFFNIGLSARSAEGFYPDYSKYLFSFWFDEKNIDYLKKSNRHFYPYSLASICTKEYFQKLLMIENKLLIRVPIFVQAIMENVLFFYPKNRAFWFNINKLVSRLGIRFVIYPSATPFNLEKSLFDCDLKLLPIRVGGLKEELFANWDDDNHLNNSSLIKRGLYPERFRTENQFVPGAADGREYFFVRGRRDDYQYCPDISRVQKLPMKYIHIKKGTLEVASDEESFMLNEGQSAWIFANIPHTLSACEDCVFQVYIDSGL